MSRAQPSTAAPAPDEPFAPLPDEGPAEPRKLSLSERARAAVAPPSVEPGGYLALLNPEQRKAVEATEGPVLVLAGAGTGKTRVLTSRIAHILHSRLAFPNQILAVTFTNKAAREKSSRIQKLLDGEDAGQSPSSHLTWLGTFHSIAAKVLRRHAEVVGLSSSFAILDTDDQLRIIKALLSEKNIDDKIYPPKLIGGIIQG